MNKLLFFFFLLFGLTAFAQTDSSLTYRKARIYNTYPCQPCPTDSLNIDPEKGITPYQYKDKDKPIKVDSATYQLIMLNKRRREKEQQPNLP